MQGVPEFFRQGVNARANQRFQRNRNRRGIVIQLGNELPFFIYPLDVALLDEHADEFFNEIGIALTAGNDGLLQLC